MAPNDRTDAAPSETLTILGCGTLGSAILFGLLSSSAQDIPGDLSISQINQDKNELQDDGNVRKPTRFIACVRTPQSAERLKKDLAVFKCPPVTIVQGENARAVRAADTILVGCQPQDLATCVGESTVKNALRGKLLISILAGVTIPQIQDVLNSTAPSDNINRKVTGGSSTNGNLSATSIVRAMPNTASFVRSSTTVITSCPNASSSDIRLVQWLFASIGTVTQITAAQFDACTALCGSTPAFFALFIEGLLDGAVALGLKRSEAQTMAADTMKGAAMLMLAGEQPEMLKEKVATPGGSTIQGLLELERKALRGNVADALVRCTAAASILGSKQV